MDITELRNRTNAARILKTEAEDLEFKKSQIKKVIDAEIKAAADHGENHASINWWYTCERVERGRYDGPAIEAAIRYYSGQGFIARQEHWCSPNGYGNTSFVIRW